MRKERWDLIYLTTTGGRQDCRHDKIKIGVLRTDRLGLRVELTGSGKRTE